MLTAEQNFQIESLEIEIKHAKAGIARQQAIQAHQRPNEGLRRGIEGNKDIIARAERDIAAIKESGPVSIRFYLACEEITGGVSTIENARIAAMQTVLTADAGTCEILTGADVYEVWRKSPGGARRVGYRAESGVLIDLRDMPAGC